MNDRTGPEGLDALDRRIDAALRRHFEPPSSLDTLGERALARRPRRTSVGPVWIAIGLAAAAAVVVWLAPWKEPGGAAPSRPEHVERIARAPVTVVPAVRTCQPVGPLESPVGMPEQVRSPDLTRLYSTMDACQRSAAALPCPENAELEQRLAATYGSEIELVPDALGFLQGPFASADWPTATILTGVAENQTSVLVAERDTTLDCCLFMELPEESGLRMFRWKLGDVVLTEITPLSEPRLLQYFE